MKLYFPMIGALAMGLAASMLVPALKADELGKRTIIKVEESIDVQGTVLPPGSYVMKLLGPTGDRRTVQIFSGDETHFIATVLANPTYRLAPTSDTELKFYEATDGRPPSLHTWFYPGDNFGFEFKSGGGEVTARSARKHTTPTTSSAGDH